VKARPQRQGECCGDFVLVAVWPTLLLGWIRGAYLGFAGQSVPQEARQWRTESWWDSWTIPPVWQFHGLCLCSAEGRACTRRFFAELTTDTFVVNANEHKDDSWSMAGSYFALAFKKSKIWSPLLQEEDFQMRFDTSLPQAVLTCMGTDLWPHFSLAYAERVDTRARNVICKQLQKRLGEVLGFLSTVHHSVVDESTFVSSLKDVLVPCWRKFHILNAGFAGSDREQNFKDIDPAEIDDFKYFMRSGKMRHYKKQRRSGEPVLDLYRRIVTREQHRERRLDDLCMEGKAWLRNHNNQAPSSWLVSWVPNQCGAFKFRPNWLLRTILFSMKNCLIYECGSELHGRDPDYYDDYCDTDDDSSDGELLEERDAKRTRAATERRSLRVLNEDSWHQTLHCVLACTALNEVYSN
jgi:hypothetical protein